MNLKLIIFIFGLIIITLILYIIWAEISLRLYIIKRDLYRCDEIDIFYVDSELKNRNIIFMFFVKRTDEYKKYEKFKKAKKFKII